MVMDSALALRATSVVTGSFSIPDLPSYFKYSLRKNSYERQVLFETKGWFFQGDFFVKPRASDSYDRDNFAFLASTCYPEADYLRIRACSDFLILLFHLDDITDDMDTTDTDSVAEIVMNTLRDPYGYDSPTRVGVLIKE
ncbi:hypothetical protein D9758_007705 [Tetrapyrgos nigripes]|uniref:Uncharacterized protein n=1 Tax=Tetrapyrgos nigripes TaxID=182062 RepID=A0A8H5G5C8_9AGAR|nr:hypothetical protein D9758_007705 [Tetrapyrgos nigripes]